MGVAPGFYSLSRLLSTASATGAHFMIPLCPILELVEYEIVDTAELTAMLYNDFLHQFLFVGP